MSRQEYNREIIKEITEYIETYPDIRFIQVLWHLNIINSNGFDITIGKHDIVDRYNEESSKTLDEIRK